MRDGEWTYHPSLKKAGGLVLTDLRHWHHRFASDVRCTRVYVGSATGSPDAGLKFKKPKRSLVLGSADLPVDRNPKAVDLPNDIGLIAPFYPGQQESAFFKTPGPALADGKTAPLSIEQQYLFMNYGIDPPHEPGALAWGCRFYPMISFYYPPAPSGADPVNYLRVDLRMEVGLDEILNLAQGAGNTTPDARPADQINQVGIFEDGTKFGTDLKTLFQRIEKPMQYEVLGVGIDWKDKETGYGFWDNIHQWPMPEGLPATPGASHAAHLHWRWGVQASKPSFALKVANFLFDLAPSAGPQFAGYLGPATPLLDPRVPIQRLAFAITKYESLLKEDAAFDPKLNPSTDPFSDLFKKARATPRPIKDGKPLVWWFSIEAFRDPSDRSEWQGTLFPQGSFFTHSAIPLKLMTPPASIGAPALFGAAQSGSTTAQKWWRPEDPKPTDGL